MFVDMPRTLPMAVPPLQIELRDYRDIDDADPLAWGDVKAKFFQDTRDQWLVRFAGTGVDMCDTLTCFDPLINGYLEDEVEPTHPAPPSKTYIEYSQLNAARLLPDYIQFPHLSSYFWTIHDDTTPGQEVIGVLHIGQLLQESRTATDLVLTGHAIMTLPDGLPSFEQRNLERRWGMLLRWILNNDFQPADPADPSVDFIGWDLPGHPLGAYVSRPGNDFGKDIYDEVSPGFSNDFHPGGAPRGVRRTPRP